MGTACIEHFGSKSRLISRIHTKDMTYQEMMSDNYSVPHWMYYASWDIQFAGSTEIYDKKPQYYETVMIQWFS